MILTCPECSTRYHVDPTSLGGGRRTVRCAHCGNRWTASPPEDAPQVVDLVTPTHPPHRSAAPAQAQKAQSSGGVIGWLLAGLLVLVLAGAVIGRNEVTQAIPASAAVYRAVGLAVTLPLELQFENVTSERLEERGLSILVVEGEVVNAGPAERGVPPIKITLLDDGGRQLKHELFQADQAKLDPGARTSFGARLINPSEQARNFSVTFEVN